MKGRETLAACGRLPFRQAAVPAATAALACVYFRFASSFGGTSISLTAVSHP